LRKLLFPGLIGFLLLVLAACSGGEAQSNPVPAQASVQEATEASPQNSEPNNSNSAVAGGGSETQLVTQGESFQFQLVCINRTLEPCDLMQEFAQRIGERTESQVEIQITSLPELGLSGQNMLRDIQSGTLAFAELYPGYVGGDWPFVEVGELLGLFPDGETQLKVALALREDEARILKEQFNAQPIAYHFYDSQIFFSRKPLRTLADFEGMKVRQHSLPLGDLIGYLGGEGQFVAFAEVYTALERGILDAGVTGVLPGHGQKWYEVTDYLVGPIPARPHNTIVMNLDRWNELPPDIQQIILEEGERYSENALTKVDQWEKEGIEKNVAAGMEHIEFTPEIKSAIRQAAIERILPNWVQRVGGPESEAVQIYNEKVAPIVGIKVNPDGTASEIN
jgi:TRAP-type C4-dicarboxylate transport system substrate-binding protein